jgi:hypothetical protein
VLRVATRLLLGGWRRIVRLPPSRDGERRARPERRYSAAVAAEQAERARQARQVERSDMSGTWAAAQAMDPGDLPLIYVTVQGASRDG